MPNYTHHQACIVIGRVLDEMGFDAPVIGEDGATACSKVAYALLTIQRRMQEVEDSWKR